MHINPLFMQVNTCLDAQDSLFTTHISYGYAAYLVLTK